MKKGKAEQKHNVQVAHLCIFVLLRDIPGDSVLPVKMKVAPGR